MKIKDFIDGRNVTYQTVRKYIQSHPELFDGHIGRRNNIVLDETAIGLLEEKYPIRTQIVENTDQLEELKSQLLQAQALIIKLQQQVVEAAPMVAAAQQNEKLLQQSFEENEKYQKALLNADEKNNELKKENQRLHDKTVNVLSEMSWRQNGKYSKAIKLVTSKNSTEQLIDILAFDAEKQIKKLKDELEKEKAKTWWDKLRGK